MEGRISRQLGCGMFLQMIIPVIPPSSMTFAHVTVYCSYKKNNVNILFEHAHLTAPFELTRIIIKVLMYINYC
jgi:hypothetical protein